MTSGAQNNGRQEPQNPGPVRFPRDDLSVRENAGLASAALNPRGGGGVQGVTGGQDQVPPASHGQPTSTLGRGHGRPACVVCLKTGETPVPPADGGSSAARLSQEASHPQANSGEDETLPSRLHSLRSKVDLNTERGSGANLYAIMLAVWHLRPATQRRFPLQHRRTRDVVRFLAWCATHGRREYAGLRELPEWDDELSSPVELPPLPNDRWAGAHSLMTFLHGVALHQLTLGAMLSSARARNRSSTHYWRGARHRNQYPDPSNWQKAALRRKLGGSEGFARSIAVKKHRAASAEELARLYGLPDLEANGNQTRARGARPTRLPADLGEGFIPLPRWLARAIDPVIQLFRQRPTAAEAAQVMRAIDTSPSRPSVARGKFGVNLIGFARGELGIGEDVRHVALALEATGIPVCILDFAPGKNISQAEDGADRFLSEEPRYGINIFCLTGIETTRYVCERGFSTLEGRYNIGLWPWELPDWPERCRHAYACVDEIWGISEYTAHAHRFAAPRPVLPMGLPVELGSIGSETRRDFGLPEDTYLYYFAFDINSSATRKNPEGLIAAFQKAFPRGGSEKAGLVLKISHPETGCRLWRRIRRAARRDPRIHVVEKTMRRPQLLALFKACDCFVSLHRAEGFGRGLAEALLLGKQVITTGFSGNLDFCREPRVALVRHRMIPLKRGDYMWGHGQSWADPDLDHAAELMRSVRENPRPTGGDDFPFQPARTGQCYAKRLREIWARHAPPPHRDRVAEGRTTAL